MIDVGIDLHGTYMFPQSLFMRKLDEQSYEYLYSAKWGNREVDTSEAKQAYHDRDGSIYSVYDWDGDTGLYYIYSGNGDAHITVAAHSKEVADKILEHTKILAPEYKEKDENKAEVTFWSMGSNGPEQRTRSLDVQDWQEIGINYTKAAHEELGIFMNKKWRPVRGGQLMLWYGPPGTGKTTALRALAREWKDWCEMHYIADPEIFFGERADYMLNVMINGADEDEGKWRLLILEDCGELLKADARQTSGQGLSRLLNSVDGLIGQGLRFMVLVTTNEDFEKLHPAVTRPGRCLTQIRFDKLAPEEVIQWLEAHKMDKPLTGSQTIASLFAEKENFINKAKSSPAYGFNVQ